MNDRMMHDVPWHMLLMVGGVLLVFALVVAAVAFFFRRPAPHSLLVADLAAARGMPGPVETGGRDDAAQPAKAHDTVFILPDISHYTRFMAGNHFAFAHAQHIVFSLINAMIEAATRTVELSKLEGDAALFFTDADRHSPEVLGETVMSIFGAFFAQRNQLMRSNLCRCKACSHIASLDLKIFVHRGDAARFKFRGSVDHFGTDVIVLHRLMKNGVGSSRYVMITDAAAGCVDLPGLSRGAQREEEIDHVGSVRATVFELNDELVDELCASSDDRPPSYGSDVIGKLAENLRSVRSALGWTA